MGSSRIDRNIVKDNPGRLMGTDTRGLVLKFVNQNT